MYPELIHLHVPLLGDVLITSFGVMVAVAFLAAYRVIVAELRRQGRDEALASVLLLGALVGGLVGAKLYYVLLHWPETRVHPLGMLFSRGGLVWYGGFIGGSLGAAFLLHRRRERVVAVADAAAPALALGYAIGRIGCFLVGDDYGRPTESWIGLAFPQGSPPTTAGNLRDLFQVSIPSVIPDAQVLRVYPTQLFETGMASLMFAVLWKLRARPHRSGCLFGVWMMLAGVERLVIEIFRAKDDRVLGPLTTAQLISVLLIGVGIYVARNRRAPVRTPEPALAAPMQAS